MKSIAKYISIAIVLMLPMDIILNILILRNSPWSVAQKTHYSVITVFCTAFTLILNFFNIIYKI